jgi:small subunit ribosomal protein S24
MHGTFPQLLSSQVIIKRRYNMIYIGALVLRSWAIQPRKIYFLVGYTEELLSCLLSCPVKLEIQTVQIKQDVAFRYI